MPTIRVGQTMHKTRVPIYSADAMASRLGSFPDLIKVDVEGFELEVLQGATRLLHTHHPALVIEIHPPQLALSGGSEDALFSLLSDSGYAWQIIHQNENALYTIKTQERQR